MYIEPEQLAEIILTKTAGKDYLVVDVRDDDFSVGNIKGCVNLASRQFLGSPSEAVEKYSHVPCLIFHCMLSQVRGPKCMKVYQRTTTAPQECLVLRGGFAAFQALDKDDVRLVENHDASFWADPYF